MHRSLEHDVSCLSRTENGSPPSRIGVGPEGVHAHRSPNGARGSFARSLTPPARKTELRVRAHFLATCLTQDPRECWSYTAGIQRTPRIRSHVRPTPLAPVRPPLPSAGR